MENLLQLILDIYYEYYEEKRTGEMERQLNKIVEMEDKFVKNSQKKNGKSTLI